MKVKIARVTLVWLVLVMLPVSGFAQPGAVITQFLPHFVAGSLPGSDWESRILLVNLAGGPNTVTVTFFDNDGNPLAVSTNRGTDSSFVVTLPKPTPEAVSSEVLEILRNSGSFVTGWAKVASLLPVGLNLEFKQFTPGSTEPVGKADVPPSPVENVLTYPLSPNNGVALVNPGSQEANVSFTAFNRAGSKVKEGTFKLARGGHRAVFFREAPFFLDATGIIVMASNIPLSGVALEFEGLVFKTIPRLPTPRRLDSKASPAKVGFVYIYSDDRPPQPGIQDRLAEYVGFQQELLDKEMLLNGFNRIQLPYDLDENGRPKVVIVNGGNREQYFDYNQKGDPFYRVRWEVLWGRANKEAPDWDRIVLFADFWLDRLVDGNRDDITINGGGSGANISALYLPFLRKSYFGDKRLYRGVPIPEFGGKPMPFGGSYGNTFEDLADASIALVNHENGHAFWFLPHSSTGNTDSNVPGFYTMVGRISQVGCMNPTRSAECILLPVEANKVATARFSRSNDYDWFDRQPSNPKVEILSKEIIGTKLRVTFKAEDPENGLRSFSVHTTASDPWTRSWRLFTHLDDLENVSVEVDITGRTTEDIIYLAVLNNRGSQETIILF